MKPTRGTLALAFGLGLAIGCGALFAGHYAARFEAEVEGPPEQVPWTGLEPAAIPTSSASRS